MGQCRAELPQDHAGLTSLFVTVQMLLDKPTEEPKVEEVAASALWLPKVNRDARCHLWSHSQISKKDPINISSNKRHKID